MPENSINKNKGNFFDQTDRFYFNQDPIEISICDNEF